MCLGVNGGIVESLLAGSLLLVGKWLLVKSLVLRVLHLSCIVVPIVDALVGKVLRLVEVVIFVKEVLLERYSAEFGLRADVLKVLEYSAELLLTGKRLGSLHSLLVSLHLGGVVLEASWNCSALLFDLVDKILVVIQI